MFFSIRKSTIGFPDGFINSSVNVTLYLSFSNVITSASFRSHMTNRLLFGNLSIVDIKLLEYLVEFAFTTSWVLW